MSSWNDYVVSIQSTCEDCDKGCIIGRDGTPWTINGSNVLNITSDEAAKLASLLNDNIEVISSCGITIGGEKYNFIKKDEKFLFFKRAGHGSLTVQWTEKSIIIAHCKEGGSFGKVNDAVFKTCIHLEQCEY